MVISLTGSSVALVLSCNLLYFFSEDDVAESKTSSTTLSNLKTYPFLPPTIIMHFVRRAAARAVSSPAKSFISQSRAITTSSPSFLLRSKIQATGISPSAFRKYSDDAAPPATDGEQSAVNNATQSVDHSAQRSSEAYTDAAGAGAAAVAGQAFIPREDRQSKPYERRDNAGSFGGNRGYGGDRGGERGGYGNRGGDRGGYGSGRGNSRGGYGGDRAPRQFTPRAPREMVPTDTVYVGNLLFEVTASDLEREFGQYGAIQSASIASDARQLSKGFGYVQFESVEQATAAIEAKNDCQFEGRRMIVNYMNKTQNEGPKNPPSKTLFVGNLAFEMSDADLNKLFREVRNVIDVRVAIDRRTGQPRGFAHADFVDVESAVKGMEALKGQEVYGRKLRLDYSLGSREHNVRQE